MSSGAVFKESIRAAKILEEQYEVATDIWSVTSFVRLRNEAMDAERYNMLHPGSKRKVSYLEKTLEGEKGVFVASSDYMRILPEGISKWVPGGLACLGTDGHGMSSAREELRRYFEIDAECIVLKTLTTLVEKGEMDKKILKKAMTDLGLEADKPNPFPL
jgi:pyruvate dehydrogenase E1 component